MGGFDHFERVGGGREDLGNQGIGVECDRCSERVQLRGTQRW